MNTLQTIWTALIVPNESLIKFIAIPLTYLDAYIVMLFFTSLLDIKATNKRKLIYVLLLGTISNILSFVVPTSYTVFINIILWPVLIFIVLKSTIIKALLAEIITLIISSSLEFLFTNAFLNLFNITSEMIVTIPLYRLIVALSIYFIIFMLTKFINHLKVNIQIFDNMKTKTKILLVVNALLIVLVIAMQF